MQLANQEAQRFNHEYIGTEHILLGLVEEGSGVAANVLRNLDIDPGKVRREVEKIVQAGPELVATGKDKGQLPQTPRTKKIIAYAIEEARNLNDEYVGTEHLLLGVLREDEGLAAQILINLGLRLEEVREEVLNLRGHTSDLAEAEPDPNDGPAEVSPTSRSALRKLEAVFGFLQNKKEAAVAAHDFEWAARLRDLTDQLRKAINYPVPSERPKRVNWLKECDFYIPLCYSDGAPVEPETLARIRQQLIEEFGGFIEFRHRVEGSWEVADLTLRDEFVIYRVLVEPAEGDRQFFLRLREEFKAHLRQKKILITFRTVYLL
jgi:hypothetical protein